MKLTKYVRARSLAAAFTLGAGIALSALTAASSVATAQELAWAKQAGGTSNPHTSGWGIAIDGRGNSYVTGYFIRTATFGEGEDNETELTAGDEDFDIFVAKYDRDGLLVWAKQAGGTDYDQGADIAIDGSGNSYVTGLFSGAATFGAGEENEIVLEGVVPSSRSTTERACSSGRSGQVVTQQEMASRSTAAATAT
jgi:hypothetical protein